jgi:hypothetical protein
MAEHQGTENGVSVNTVTVTFTDYRQGDNGADQNGRVVDRLKKSKEVYIDRMTELGHQYGREWAEDGAEYEQLMRLSEWNNLRDKNNEFHYHGLHCILTQGNIETETADTFWGAVDNFWEDVLREDNTSLADDSTFLEAFIEGALEVWNQVEDKL